MPTLNALAELTGKVRHLGTVLMATANFPGLRTAKSVVLRYSLTCRKIYDVPSASSRPPAAAVRKSAAKRVCSTQIGRIGRTSAGDAVKCADRAGRDDKSRDGGKSLVSW